MELRARARVDRGEGQRAQHSAERQRSGGDARHPAQTTPGVALYQRVEIDAQHIGGELQPCEPTPVATRAQINRERFGAWCVGGAHRTRQAGERAAALLGTGDDDAQNVRNGPRRQEMRELGFHPARSARGG